jgi:hypothetical protein
MSLSTRSVSGGEYYCETWLQLRSEVYANFIITEKGRVFMRLEFYVRFAKLFEQVYQSVTCI